MWVNNLYFVIIIIIASTTTFGQNIKVLDQNNSSPLANVNVYFDSIGTTTDKYGLCNIYQFNPSDLVTFSLIGYKEIRLVKSKITNIIYMEKQSIPMELVEVMGQKKRSTKRYMKLERDVRKVYPYAKTIRTLLDNYVSIIDSLDNYSYFNKKLNKKKIFSDIENKLILEYGYSIKKLTKNQGRILIRLIDRQTNRTSYSIIKDFRNIFSATFWQFTARLFGHNLKSTFNPDKGEDLMIQFIIRRIEEKNTNQT